MGRWYIIRVIDSRFFKIFYFFIFFFFILFEGSARTSVFSVFVENVRDIIERNTAATRRARFGLFLKCHKFRVHFV